MKCYITLSESGRVKGKKGKGGREGSRRPQRRLQVCPLISFFLYLFLCVLLSAYEFISLAISMASRDTQQLIFMCAKNILVCLYVFFSLIQCFLAKQIFNDDCQVGLGDSFIAINSLPVVT